MAKFGFTLAETIVEEPVRKTAELLLDSGFTWIEARFPKYEVDGATFRTYSCAVEELIRKFKPGLSIHLPITDLNPASPNRRIRSETIKQLGEAIRFGARFGARLAVLHPGFVSGYEFPDGDTRDEAEPKLRVAFEQSVDAVRQCSRHARLHSIDLGVENLFSRYDLVRTPEEMQRFVSRLRKGVGQGNTKVVLDTGHAHRAGVSPARFLRELGEAIGHVHLHDNAGECDSHLAPGRGSVDFGALFDERGFWAEYDGAFVFELELSEGCVEEMMKASEYVRSLLKRAEQV